MDERALIHTYFARRQGPRADVVLGIGDDAALLRFAPGFELVVATDLIVEGTHFPPGTPAAAVGHRCLAVNLSDLAATGAEPLWFTLCLSLPRVEPEWLAGFSDGLFRLAERFGVALVGGDTVRGATGAGVTIHGRIAPGHALRRSGARPGDGIWVTGSPGDAVAGRLLLGSAATSPEAVHLMHRFLYPEPRVAAGRALVGVASAMIDVSDGLHDDLGKLMAASGTGAELDVAALPLSAPLRTVAGDLAVARALTGGDDYELCFTVPAGHTRQVEEALATVGTPAARIGTVTSGAGLRWRQAGAEFVVPDLTFRHFE